MSMTQEEPRKGTFNIWDQKGHRVYSDKYEYLKKEIPEAYEFMKRSHDVSEYVRNQSKNIKQFFERIDKQLVSVTANLPIKILRIATQNPKFRLLQTTHSHPIGQVHTGWEKLHIDEIGWGGRISALYNKDYGSERIFDAICINSGTGGYRGNTAGYSVEYDMSLFIKDLPLVYKEFLSFVNDSEIKILGQMLNSIDVKDIQLAQEIMRNDNSITDKINNIWNLLQIEDCLTKSSTPNVFASWLINDVWNKYQSQEVKFETHSEIPNEREYWANKKLNGNKIH